MGFYKKINPNVHYAFSHGDYNTGNLFIDESTNSISLIDWGNYGVGFIDFDVIKYLYSCGVSFKLIESVYLNQIGDHNEETMTRKSMFTFILIDLWLSLQSEKDFQELIDNQLMPAVDYIEKLVLKRF